MRWPSCKIKSVANPEIFAIQLPISFERALKEATVDVKAQKQEIDFNREILNFRRVMMNRAMAKLKNKQDAENFVQEAYLKALVDNAARPWLPYSSNWRNDLSAWLCRIVDNAITSHFRQKREFIELDNCNIKDHDTYFERAEIDDLILQLPDEEREIIEYSMEGLKPADIAKLHGSDYKTVKNMQEKSFKKMREKLSQ